jgi:hypothetical protein
MSWDARRSLDAMRLLRALVDQAKAASELEDDEEVVGHTVIPTAAVAMAAGMDLGTPRFHVARDQLLELLALERDEDTDYTISTASSKIPSRSRSRARRRSCYERRGSDALCTQVPRRRILRSSHH